MAASESQKLGAGVRGDSGGHIQYMSLKNTRNEGSRRHCCQNKAALSPFKNLLWSVTPCSSVDKRLGHHLDVLRENYSMGLISSRVFSDNYCFFKDIYLVYVGSQINGYHSFRIFP